jgi:hypothetical protein
VDADPTDAMAPNMQDTAKMERNGPVPHTNEVREATTRGP